MKNRTLTTRLSSYLIRNSVFALIVFMFGCSSATKKNAEQPKVENLLQNKSETVDTTRYVSLNKLWVVGDFDGDGKQDTIRQNTVSQKTHLSFDSIPAYLLETDSVGEYLAKLQSDVVLTLQNRKQTPLHLGGCATGLYCLINIGDNNHDKKDEIACVKDNCDMSRCNVCRIYSLGNNKWVELKSFEIHESAFEYEGETAPIFKEIKGFLEFRNHKWMYLDYYKWFSAASPKDTVMLPLKVGKLN